MDNIKRSVINLFPILSWSKKYNREKGIADLIAAITLAMTLIPQSIAFSALAGLDPQYGLYAAFPGSFVYAFMGRCPQISIGPTALLSVIIFVYTEGNEDLAIFLCFIGGIIELIIGLAQLGFLVDYVSIPVVSGFTLAAIVTIASSQIKTLLGLQFSSPPSVFHAWIKIVQKISTLRIADTLMSTCCIIVLFVMDSLAKRAKKSKLFFFYLSTTKNAIVLVLASVIASLIYKDLRTPLIITGPITQGLPVPKLPPFQTNISGTTYNTMDMVVQLQEGLLVIPFVAILANIAIAKAFAKSESVKATYEIIALGFCNIVSSFFQSYSVNAAFSRSAISQSSGVKTPAASIYTGMLVMLALVLLTPYFFFIPKASLASVVIYAVLQMLKLPIIKHIWDVNRIDVITLFGTFFCGLHLGIEMAIFCGVAIDFLILFYNYSPSKLDIEYIDNKVQLPHYAVQLVGGFQFHNAEKTRRRLKFLINETHPFVKPSTDNHNAKSGNAQKSPNEVLLMKDEPNGNVAYGIKPAEPENHSKLDQSANGNKPVEQTSKSVSREKGYCWIVVMFCDKLSRVDYTFLQSMKSLILVWPRSGKIIWCDMSPDIKVKFEQVVQGLTYCDREHLDAVLAGINTSTKLFRDNKDHAP